MTNEYLGRLSAEDKDKINTLDDISTRKVARVTKLPYSQVRRYIEWRDQNVLGLIPTINSPKILVWDIETSPINAWVWGMWKQNVIAIERDCYRLSFAYGWFNLSFSGL